MSVTSTSRSGSGPSTWILAVRLTARRGVRLLSRIKASNILSKFSSRGQCWGSASPHSASPSSRLRQRSHYDVSSLRVERLRDVGNGSSNSTPSSCLSRQITRHLRAELLAAVRHNVNSSGTVSAFNPLSLAPPLERLLTTQGLGGRLLPRSIVPESIHSTRACCRRSSSIFTSTLLSIHRISRGRA
jgi:hypothetical protein